MAIYGNAWNCSRLAEHPRGAETNCLFSGRWRRVVFMSNDYFRLDALVIVDFALVVNVALPTGLEGVFFFAVGASIFLGSELCSRADPRQGTKKRPHKKKRPPTQSATSTLTPKDMTAVKIRGFPPR